MMRKLWHREVISPRAKVTHNCQTPEVLIQFNPCIFIEHLLNVITDRVDKNCTLKVRRNLNAIVL